MVKDEQGRFPNYLLTTDDINKYLKKRIPDTYVGVFSRQDIPQLMKHMFMDYEDKAFSVINLDDKEGDGTHWVVLSYLDQSFLYIDSFSMPPPVEAVKTAKKLKVDLYYNKTLLQHPDDVSCGFWAIKVILELNANKDLSLNIVKY